MSLYIDEIMFQKKLNDKSFTVKGFKGRLPFSQSQVREIWFQGIANGLEEGLRLASLEGQIIEINTNIRNPRHREFFDKFCELSKEYNCAIQYHPLLGMCIIDLSKDSYE